VHIEIEHLLELQKVDSKLFTTQAQLQGSPVEVEHLKTRITGVELDIQKLHAGIREMELKAASLNGERKEIEGKIAKYKTQQMEVKKNDEYQALTAEIENLTAKASGVEDQELTVLMEIDDQRKVVAEQEKEHRKSITELEGEIKHVEKKISLLESEFDGLEDAVAKAKENVSATFIAGYEQAKNRQKRPPWVVPIEEHRCMGCHLRISGALESDSRNPETPTHCNQCGRMVYLP